MEFIAENYIWIILIGVVILMTLIGYIADKTDFGKNKPVKVKKEKPVKVKKEKIKKEKNEEVAEEEINVDELPKNDIDPMNDFPMENDENMDDVKTEQAFDTDEMDLSPKVDNDFDYELNDDSEVEQQAVPVQDEVASNAEIKEEPVSEDLFTGFDDTTSTPDEEKISEELLGDKKEDLEIELPSIDTLNKELEEDSEDDDVWKF